MINLVFSIYLKSAYEKIETGAYLWPISIGKLPVNQQLYSSLNGLSVRVPI